MNPAYLMEPSIKRRCCDNCGAAEVVRTHRRGTFEHCLAVLGLYPFICRNCARRSLRVEWEQAAAACLLGMVTLFALGTSAALVLRMRLLAGGTRPKVAAAAPPRAVLAAARSRASLTDTDIVEMSRAGISETVMLKLIRLTPHRFAVDAKSLTAMRRSGVPNDVLAEMIDVTLKEPETAADSAPRIEPAPEPPKPLRLADAARGK